MCRGNTSINEQMREQFAEPNHLRATGHRATGTLVRATLCALSLLLLLARTPIVGDGLRYLLVEGGFLMIHACRLRLSRDPFLWAELIPSKPESPGRRRLLLSRYFEG